MLERAPDVGRGKAAIVLSLDELKEQFGLRVNGACEDLREQSYLGLFSTVLNARIDEDAFLMKSHNLLEGVRERCCQCQAVLGGCWTGTDQVQAALSSNLSDVGENVLRLEGYMLNVRAVSMYEVIHLPFLALLRLDNGKVEVGRVIALTKLRATHIILRHVAA